MGANHLLGPVKRAPRCPGCFPLERGCQLGVHSASWGPRWKWGSCDLVVLRTSLWLRVVLDASRREMIPAWRRGALGAFGHKRESGPDVPATFIEFLVPAELCAQVHLMPAAL